MMKKLAAILTAGVLVFGLAACGNSEDKTTDNSGTTAENTDTSTETAQQNEMAGTEEGTAAETQEDKSLVVYFSATGNTKAAAEILAQMQGADLYEIVPEEPYTDEDLDYNNSASRSTTEQNDESVRPAISGSIDNFNDYGVVYVGYPIWWGDMPRILYTFFDTYDFAGKTIVPFCTSGGSGVSGTPVTIEELEPEAAVLEGHEAEGETDIAEWISSIGL